MVGESLYDQVLREIVLALGAALFAANAFALYRRRSDAQRTVRRTVARNRAGSPVRGYKRDEATKDLAQAPLARTVTYLCIGLVVMIWGVASVATR